MTIYQLRVFATVAKLKNFTLAAESLGIRQPSVSILIQGLQRELGIKLFEKLGKKILLTRAGEELLSRVEKILPEVDGIKNAMAEIGGLKKGKIEVGGSFTAGASFLPLAVQAFKKQYPGIDVTLRVQNSLALEKELSEGEIDLAILSSPPESPNLIGEPYREEEIVFFVPPSHPLANKRSLPLELLAKEAFVSNKKGTSMRDIIEQRFVEKGLAFKVIMELDVSSGSRDTIKNTVASGLGIGYNFMSHIIWDVKAGRLKVLDVPELKLNRTLHIALHKDKKTSSQVRAFIEFLRLYNENAGGAPLFPRSQKAVKTNVFLKGLKQD